MLHYNALHTNMFTGSIVEWVDLNSSELHWLRWFHAKVLDDEEDPLFRTSSDPLGGQCQLAAMECVKRFQTWCQPESPGTWEKPTLEANLTLVGSVNFFPLAKSNHRVFDFWDYQKLGSIAKQLGKWDSGITIPDIFHFWAKSNYHYHIVGPLHPPCNIIHTHRFYFCSALVWTDQPVVAEQSPGEMQARHIAKAKQATSSKWLGDFMVISGWNLWTHVDKVYPMNSCSPFSSTPKTYDIYIIYNICNIIYIYIIYIYIYCMYIYIVCIYIYTDRSKLLRPLLGWIAEAVYPRWVQRDQRDSFNHLGGQGMVSFVDHGDLLPAKLVAPSRIFENPKKSSKCYLYILRNRSVRRPKVPKFQS
jgi:hypothetical protein